MGLVGQKWVKKKTENADRLKALTDSVPQLSCNSIYTRDVVHAGGRCMAKTYRSKDPCVGLSVGNLLTPTAQAHPR